MTTAAVMYAVAAPSAAAAQSARPNYSGTWVMDTTKSVVNGQLSAPTSATITIVQHGDTITMDREANSAMGPVKTHVVFAIDGKPWKNSLPVNGEDLPISSVLTWENGTLVIHSTFSVQGTDVEQIDKWNMGADGKTLTTFRSLSAGGQDIGSGSLTYNKKP